MEAAKLLDDPDHINTFLSMIGPPRTTDTFDTAPENKKDERELGNEQVITDDKENECPTTPGFDLNKERAAGVVTPEVRSRAQSATSSPAVGTTAPPPTPVHAVTMTGLAGKLEPIDEDETDVLVKLVQDSKLGLIDSKFAHKLCRPVGEYRPGNSGSYKQHTPDRAEIPPSFAPKMKKETGIEDPGKDYMDQVVSGLKKQQQQQHIHDVKIENGVLTGELHRVGQSPELSKATHDAATPAKHVEKVSRDMKTAEAEFSGKAAAGESSSIQAQEADFGTDDAEIVENRECLTQFKSWGKPEARDKPTARVRRLVLSDLPADADLSLVQSLVHGGSIDDMILMGASQVAYVRFTSGNACDTYCAKYPNGLTFKYKGRLHTVFVEKCKDADVISGMLQGYIDCGASRCVRAIGVHEDWGMGAMMRLAEGKCHKRKVENITDVYRSGVRTIVFRFTSISDAVAFKGMLMQDEDWEACNIQFSLDPCEKATTVHLE